MTAQQAGNAFGCAMVALFVLAALILVAIEPRLPAQEPVTRPVAACEEDEVLVGRGEFRDGYWDAYVCGPALDDLEVPS